MLSEVAQKPLLREQKSRTSFIEAVTCCTVCFVRRYINTKDNYTLSQAGLLPHPSDTTLTKQKEITKRQTALAHSVRRVYVTMLK